MFRSAAATALVALAACSEVAAEAPRIMPVDGTLRSVRIAPGQTLLDVAAEGGFGFDAVARLNPRVDPWIPKAGTPVELPTRYVLPDAEPEGLVVNVPEMRLYDFSRHPPLVLAAAIGDLADPSILGDFLVGGKQIDPAWHVPAVIRAERPDLPAVVSPGPENPLGSRWMRIGRTSYGIHGTNSRWSIGRQATHGCVRLYERDVTALFDRTPTGTRIQLVYQPFKWGVELGALYLEVHPDLYERFDDPVAAALQTPNAHGLAQRLDLDRVRRTIEEARGIPVLVERPPDASPMAATSSPTS